MVLRFAHFLLAVLVLGLSLVGSLQAAAGPKDIVLVLDNSGSMKKNDPGFLTGVAVREFLDRLEGDNRVAILLFDQTARLVLPLTPLTEESRPDFLLSLDKVDYRGLLTDSPAAIERAIYELKTNGRPNADKSIVFMTDGIVDTGNKAMDAEKSGWLRNDLAGDAAEASVRIFGIAFTENADFLLIQSLSKRTSGDYFRAYSAADIDGVFQRVIEVLDESKPVLVAEPAPPITLPEPAVTLPETSFGETTATPEPMPSVSETFQPAVGGEQMPSVESSVSALPQPGSMLPEPGSALPGPDSALTEPAAPAESGGGLPTLSLPQIETAASETSEAVEPPIESQPADPETAATEPPPETATPALPATVPPAPSAASELPLPLPILIAVGVGVLVLVIAIFVLMRRKSGKKEPAHEQIPKAFLNDLGGVSAQQSYELTDKLTIVGRLAGSDADAVNYIVIEEATIGRRHAMIEFKDHSFWVIDQSSLNGTFVNNKRIESETRLKHGDRLRFHKHEFEFLVLDMFETDRTMMSHTVFADMSNEIEDQDVTQARPSTDTAEGSEKTTANPLAK